MPCFTSTTGIRVTLDRMSVKMLGCFGSRCWTNTKANGASTGRWDSNSENASNPPAEAPMPTTGHTSLDGCGAAAPLPADEAVPCPPGPLRPGVSGVGGGVHPLPAAHREHGPLWMTVDMWTTCGAFYAVWREARLKARDVSEPAECPPSPPERDALVRVRCSGAWRRCRRSTTRPHRPTPLM